MSIHEIADDDVVRTPRGGRRERAPAAARARAAARVPRRPGLGAGEPRIEPVGDGHSNVTYAIARGDAEFVLRRPPRPPLPPSAHDVLREARVLRALEGRARVPQVLAVCDDEAVIGAPFYVMERVDGHRRDDRRARRARHAGGPPAHGRGARRRARRAARRRLARGRARGVRQADRLPRAPGAALPRAVGRQPHPRDPGGRARRGAGSRRHMPEPEPATIVHGDYRLGNTMFAPQAPARLVAIFDWEMATIGDPLADLGYLCTLWTDRDDPPLGMFELTGVTREPGFHHPRRARRPLRGAVGTLDDRHPLVPDARALEVDRVHGGQLQARDRRRDATTRSSSGSATASSSSPSARRR